MTRCQCLVNRQSSHLVDEGADKINETALQFGELCCFVSVHHWLVGSTRIKSIICKYYIICTWVHHVINIPGEEFLRCWIYGQL